MTVEEPEQKLATTHKERQVVVCATIFLRPYLSWSQLTVRTDQWELTWQLTMTEATAELGRWMLYILDFDFNIFHQEGMRDQAVDVFSHVKYDKGDKIYWKTVLYRCGYSNKNTLRMKTWRTSPMMKASVIIGMRNENQTSTY